MCTTEVEVGGRKGGSGVATARNAIPLLFLDLISLAMASIEGLNQSHHLQARGKLSMASLHWQG